MWKRYLSSRDEVVARYQKTVSERRDSADDGGYCELFERPLVNQRGDRSSETGVVDVVLHLDVDTDDQRRNDQLTRLRDFLFRQYNLRAGYPMLVSRT